LISYFQAIVIGLLQGVTELFPISSLGHSVLIPALFGWEGLVQGQSADESFYLAFLVGLHVATALALLVFFRRDWARVIRGFGRSLRARRIPEGDTDARMAWLLIVGTIPVGIVGLVFEHSLRTLFAKPIAAAIFLIINGLVLLGGEQVRKRSDAHARSGRAPRRSLSTFGPLDGLLVGGSEILALFAGMSRSGVTMVAGLLRGLAAGVYKLHDLVGPNGQGVRGQILVGSVVAGFAAYASVRFLVRWFETRTMTPFGIYCVVFGAFCLVRFA
jgi:undecaprenyl-diphosphatase